MGWAGIQWNDAVISGSLRGLRGGSWGYDVYALASPSRGNLGPSYENYFVGFRVASVPEPTPVMLTIIASGVLVMRRKR